MRGMSVVTGSMAVSLVHQVRNSCRPLKRALFAPIDLPALTRWANDFRRYAARARFVPTRGCEIESCNRLISIG